MLLWDKKVSAEQKVKYTRFEIQEFYCLTPVSNLGNLVDVMPDTIALKYAVFFYLNEIKVQKQCIWSKLLTEKSNMYRG